MDSAVAGNVQGLDLKVDIRTVLSKEYFEQERAGIFRRAWLPISHTYSIPRPGDYLVRKLPGLDTALLIVRGSDGRVRAFHNICRHRGSPLAAEPGGNRKAFACGFHGWVYDTAGKLLRVTDEENFHFDKSGLGLIPVHCEEWETLIFVNLASRPPMTLREWLGEELFDGYAGYFDGFSPTPPYRTEVNCNWNLAVNSFTENYHTLYLHRHTMPDYQGGEENPLRHLPAMELMKRHARYSTPANPYHRQRPAEALAYSYTRPVIPTFVQDFAGLPPNVNYRRVSNWAFDVVELFPNYVFLTGKNWFVEMWFWPLTHNRTVFEGALCLQPPRNLAEKAAQAMPTTLAREVICEDMSLLESQQASLETGALTQFHLNDEEILLAHHYRVSREMIAEFEKSNRHDGSAT
ncbi:MAG TPA: aromatic ring-hydroxylating dioxygenase subunit alpha [Candidatus Binataceae bacterium]|nr:aromatic ring-hydroxylating dioxygenase subunit alpha [Candidatus Binataceae bacterium]